MSKSIASCQIKPTPQSPHTQMKATQDNEKKERKKENKTKKENLLYLKWHLYNIYQIVINL